MHPVLNTATYSFIYPRLLICVHTEDTSVFVPSIYIYTYTSSEQGPSDPQKQFRGPQITKRSANSVFKHVSGYLCVVCTDLRPRRVMRAFAAVSTTLSPIRPTALVRETRRQRPLHEALPPKWCNASLLIQNSTDTNLTITVTARSTHMAHHKLIHANDDTQTSIA